MTKHTPGQGSMTTSLPTQPTDATDWKAIAIALGQRVNFAVTHCNCKSPGLLNTETRTVTHWRDYMAEALEMLPGVKIDREIMATLDMPAAKKRKAQAEILAARAKTRGAAA